jgi:TolB-like protein/DNA-binding winged helix-turn-helix (wHTH) protein/tetratricopeptide (TPR) repeat protein
LRKAGRLVRLRPQGLKLLTLLVTRPREVIPRDKIAGSLWDEGVFVDFEQGVNHIVKQVRAALGDEADSPRYVETLPRHGYRFIAPVEAVGDATEASDPSVPCNPTLLIEAVAGGHAEQPPAEMMGRRVELDATPNPPFTESVGRAPLSRTSRRPIATSLAVCVVLFTVGVWWLAAARHSPPSNDIPSLAVLPFATIGGGADYLADGLTQALTTELGKMQGLHVIASNTAFGYRDRPTLRTVAHELSVSLVVTGSVQQDKTLMRIDASLISAAEGRTLWTEQFTAPQADLLTIQSELSAQIAGTLSRTVGVATTTHVPPPTTSAGAYDAYLQGVWHLHGRSFPTAITQANAAGWRTAVSDLERAVDIDPQFALARAALASAYTQLFFYQSTERGWDEQAFVQIQRALAIDPNLPEAYLARAQLTWTARNRFPHEAAIRDLRRALSLNPNLADAYQELEKVYYHLGLTDKVIAAGRQVQRLDPAQALFSNRTFRALIDARRLEQLQPDFEHDVRLGPYARGDALVALGRLPEALQLLAESKAGVPGDREFDIGVLALLGVVCARLNERDRAQQILTTVMPAAENPQALSHMHHAQLHIGATLGVLGRKDEAVRWLTRAADEGYPSYPRFATDESLAPLRGYAPFEALLQRLRTDWERWQKTL